MEKTTQTEVSDHLVTTLGMKGPWLKAKEANAVLGMETMHLVLISVLFNTSYCSCQFDESI